MIRNRRKIELLAVVLILGSAGLLVASRWQNFDTNVVLADPSGIKYTGAGKCAAAACHGAATPTDGGNTRHNENTHWSKNDKHAKAFKSLKSTVPATAQMEKALNLKAESSNRCTSCHALSGLTLKEPIARVHLTPDQIDPRGYGIEDGVSCDACHGPADKYIGPHATKGWTDGQRPMGVLKLYDEWGLYDTKDMKLRANSCVSCHLKIEADLVAAGHPVPKFDFINVMGAGEEWIHWSDKGAWVGVKSLTMVRAVGLREAAWQLGERAEKNAAEDLRKDAYSQMLGLLLPIRQIALIVDAGSAQVITDRLADIHAGWADGAKVMAACKALAAAADSVADKLNATKIEQGFVDKLLAGVCAEAELAGKSYYTAYHHCWTLYLLVSNAMTDGKIDGGEEKSGKIEGLFEPLADLATFDVAAYAAKAKEIASVFPGGKALGIPAGGPFASGAAPAPAPAPAPEPAKVEAAPAPAPVPEAKPAVEAPKVEAKPEAPPEPKKVEAPVEVKPEPKQTPATAGVQELPKFEPLPPDQWGKFIFCPNCGTKWQSGARFCGKCGQKLPVITP